MRSPAVTGVPCLPPDSVCKPLASTDQFDQRALPPKRELLRPLMNGAHVSPNSQPSIFTTSHRSPRPLSTTTSSNWVDYCKMCVSVCMLHSLFVGAYRIGLLFCKTVFWAETGTTRGWLVSFFFIQTLSREKGIIKARTFVSILVKGIWMRAYPIIGCLHLSCYPRGQGYPIAQGGDFTKPHRQAAGRGGYRGAGQRCVSVLACVCVGVLSSFHEGSDRSAGSSDWEFYISASL